MKRFALLTALVVFPLSGCGVGDLPSGMSREEAKDALSKLSPQDQIRYVSSSPMPPEQKKQRYKEIEEKTGVKAADVLGPQAGGTGG